MENVDIIQNKLKQLLKQFSDLKNENKNLLRIIEEQNKNALIAEKEITELKVNLEKISSKQNKMNSEFKKNIETKIDSCFKEIDKCLALLNH